MSLRVDCHIHQIFPVLFAQVSTVSTNTDLIRIKTRKCARYGFLVRIDENNLPEIVLAGKIKHGIDMIPANRYLVRTFLFS